MHITDQVHIVKQIVQANGSSLTNFTRMNISAWYCRLRNTKGIWPLKKPAPLILKVLFSKTQSNLDKLQKRRDVKKPIVILAVAEYFDFFFLFNITNISSINCMSTSYHHISALEVLRRCAIQIYVLLTYLSQNTSVWHNNRRHMHRHTHDNLTHTESQIPSPYDCFTRSCSHISEVWWDR